MDTIYKTKHIEAFIKSLKNYDDVIDLSDMNIFEATKAIITVSSYYFVKNPTKKIKYKVSGPSIKEILKDIPSNNTIELV